MPSKGKAITASMLLAFAFTASASIAFANVENSSFLATKSVSQVREIKVPVFPSSLTLVTTTPSLVSRSALEAETFCPFFLRISIAFSKSPSASVRAFLQSIIPAPVFCLNLFTSCAVIAIGLYFFV